MADSILGLLTEQLGGAATEQLSQQLGTDPSTTAQAVSTALPLLMGALGQNAAKPEGAEALLGALGQHDGSVLNDVAGFLGSGGNTDDGDKIVGHIFGGNQGGIQQSLGQATGMDAGSSGQLLSMLAPVVMGALGQQQQSQGLDVGGLASMLAGESQQANSQLGGMASLLDMDGDGSIVDDVVNLGSKLLGGLMGGKK